LRFIVLSSITVLHLASFRLAKDSLPLLHSTRPRYNNPDCSASNRVHTRPYTVNRECSIHVAYIYGNQLYRSLLWQLCSGAVALLSAGRVVRVCGMKFSNEPAYGMALDCVNMPVATLPVALVSRISRGRGELKPHYATSAPARLERDNLNHRVPVIMLQVLVE